MEESFLNQLSATCNVTAAAACAGVTARVAYHRRRVDVAFAEGWSHALRLGYEALELRLVGRALAGDAGAADDVDIDLTMRILGQRRSSDRTARGSDASARRGAAATRRLSSHELEAMLLKRIAAFARPSDAGA